MSSLNDVNGAGGRHNGDTETQDEATCLQLANNARVVDGRAVDDASDDDDCCTDEHTHFPSPGVGQWANSRQGGDATNLVHGGVDCLPFSGL